MKSNGIYGFTTAETRWLSNFWTCPVMFEGVLYPSSEHAYVAAKTLDLSIRQQIATTNTAGQVKRLGRDIKLRPDWDEVKRDIMKKILRDKFTRNPELQAKLISTDTLYLEETNTWGDTYWGVCRGVGQNNLGNILMELRNEMVSNTTNLNNVA